MISLTDYRAQHHLPSPPPPWRRVRPWGGLRVLASLVLAWLVVATGYAVAVLSLWRCWP